MNKLVKKELSFYNKGIALFFGKFILDINKYCIIYFDYQSNFRKERGENH